MESPRPSSPAIRVFHSALIAVAALFLAVAGAAEPPATAEIHKAARAAMDKFAPALDGAEVKKTHGFAADDDLGQIRFGTPVEQKLLPKDLLEDPSKKSSAELLKDTGVWMVPVLSRDKLACLVSVRRDVAGQWTEDRLGMVELARALDAVCRAWPADKGYRPVLVVAPSLQRFFVQVPQQAPENLTPLDIHAPASGVPDTWKTLKPAATTIDSLRK